MFPNDYETVPTIDKVCLAILVGGIAIGLALFALALLPLTLATVCIILLNRIEETRYPITLFFIQVGLGCVGVLGLHAWFQFVILPLGLSL